MSRLNYDLSGHFPLDLKLLKYSRCLKSVLCHQNVWSIIVICYNWPCRSTDMLSLVDKTLWKNIAGLEETQKSMYHINISLSSWRMMINWPISKQYVIVIITRL